MRRSKRSRRGGVPMAFERCRLSSVSRLSSEIPSRRAAQPGPSLAHPVPARRSQAALRAPTMNLPSRNFNLENAWWNKMRVVWFVKSLQSRSKFASRVGRGRAAEKEPTGARTVVLGACSCTAPSRFHSSKGGRAQYSVACPRGHTTKKQGPRYPAHLRTIINNSQQKKRAYAMLAR